MNINLAAIAKRTPAVVCVHGIGFNGLGIVRGLGRARIDVTVVEVSSGPCLAPKSKYCGRSISLEDCDSSAIFETLMNLADEYQCKPVLFFDNDKMMNALAEYAEDIRTKYYLTSDLQHASKFTDKEFQLTAAAAAGIAVPRTWLPTTWAEFDQIASESDCELIAKPSPTYFSSGRETPFKTIGAENAMQLRDRLSAICKTPRGTIVQEYIGGGDRQVHVAMSYRNRRTGAVNSATIQKIRQTPPGAGVMAVGKPVPLPEARELTHKFLEYLNIDGLSETEFKLSPLDHKYYFIECNPRTAGFHTAGLPVGFNLPLIAHCESSGVDTSLAEFEQTECDTYWVYADALISSWVYARRLQAPFRRWFLRRKEWAVFASDDTRPFFYHILIFFSQLVNSVRRKVLDLIRAISNPLRKRV
jgi:predicted ATP-grasp superfamily ATP-dependent carboligase